MRRSLLVPLIAVAGDVSVSDPAALVAHWRFDDQFGGVAADSSGNGHSATLLGGAAFGVDTPDSSPSAMDLDGSDDAAEAPPVDVDGSGLTVAAWFKPGSFGVLDARLVSKATGTAANDHIFMLSTIHTSGSMRLRARVRVGGTTTTLIADSGNLSVGQWQHAALTHDGSVLRLYLDGVEVGATALGGQVDSDGSVGVGIGSQPAGAGSRHFDGLIDDVRIYRQALAAHEVGVLVDSPG